MKVSKVTGYLLLGMILVAGILFFVGNNALAEDVTITTYYPAPYGVYGELCLKTGNTTVTDGDDLGTIEFRGEDSGTYTNKIGAMIRAEASGTWDGATEYDAETELQFFTQSNGATNSLGTPNMVIDSTGNVGIGRSSSIQGPLHVNYPYAKTDTTERVVGTWSSNEASGYNQLYMTAKGHATDQASRVWKLQTSLQGTGDAGILALQSGGGNVGIGTTSPQSYVKLEVNTTGSKSIYTMDSANGGLLIGHQGSSIQGRSTSHANTDLYLNNFGGNVGIGTTSPGSYKCYVNGTGYLNAAAWVYSSDKRLKENISYIQEGLNVIEQLKPVKFDYINGEKKQVGFVSQEAQEVLPDIVTEGADGMLGMKIDSIIPYLVKAIQEQQKEIEALEAKLR